METEDTHLNPLTQIRLSHRCRHHNAPDAPDLCEDDVSILSHLSVSSASSSFFPLLYTFYKNNTTRQTLDVFDVHLGVEFAMRAGLANEVSVRKGERASIMWEGSYIRKTEREREEREESKKSER